MDVREIEGLNPFNFFLNSVSGSPMQCQMCARECARELCYLFGMVDPYRSITAL